MIHNAKPTVSKIYIDKKRSSQRLYLAGRFDNCKLHSLLKYWLDIFQFHRVFVDSVRIWINFKFRV